MKKQLLPSNSNHPFNYNTGSVIYNPDKLIAEKSWDVFKTIEAEPFTQGCIEQRINNALSLEAEYIGDKVDKKHLEILQGIMQRLFQQGIIEKILKARFISPQPVVFKWEALDGLWQPVEVFSIEPERIVYTADNELRLLTKEKASEGEPVNPYNFLIVTNKADYNNPYGKSLLTHAYWPTFVMREVSKYWVEFAEKHGQPWQDVTVTEQAIRAYQKEDSSLTLEDIIELIHEAVKDMRQDDTFTHPEGINIEFQNPVASSNSNLYDKLLLYCKKVISVLILGHEGAAISTAGELGEKQNAMAVRADIKQADIAFLEKYLNKVVQWIYEINFNDKEAPRLALFEANDIKYYKDRAEVHKILSEFGVQFNKDFVEYEYGIPQTQFDIAGPIASIPEAKASFNTDELSREQLKLQDELAEYITDSEDFKAASDELQNPILDILGNSDSYPEAIDKIQQAYNKMETDKNEDLFNRLLFTSLLLGYTNGGDDGDD